MEIDQSIFDHACDLYAKGASMATISRELSHPSRVRGLKSLKSGGK